MLHKVELPNNWTEDLAYFCGLIIGDGSLPNAKSKRPNGKVQIRYSIQFFCMHLDFLKDTYQPLFIRLFNIKPATRIQKIVKNPVYNCRIESKQTYNFLKGLGITTGRKARIVTVPHMPKKYNYAFLAGLLDTDGGKKGSGFGFTTASPYLAQFCEKMFKKMKLSHHSCPWHYNNYVYHQIYIHKNDSHKLLKFVPLRQKEKIAFILSLSASVAQTGSARHW